MMNLPVARTADLVEQEAEAELLIYDTRNSKTYLLNETSKNVFIACAEGLSFDELKRRHRYSDDLIHFALAELRANGLLEGETSDHFRGLSRREVIKRVGLASMAALPVIAALTAPTAANAASNCPDPFTPSGIPNGCRTGGSINDVESCEGRSDADRTGLCQDFGGVFRNRCASGNAAYAGNCVTTGPSSSNYNCVCAP